MPRTISASRGAGLFIAQSDRKMMIIWNFHLARHSITDKFTNFAERLSAAGSADGAMVPFNGPAKAAVDDVRIADMV